MVGSLTCSVGQIPHALAPDADVVVDRQILTAHILLLQRPLVEQLHSRLGRSFIHISETISYSACLALFGRLSLEKCSLCNVQTTSRERPKSAPYLRLKKTRKRKPLFLQLETTKALKKSKN